MSKSDTKATQYVGAMGGGEPKPQRARKKFLVRHIMPSDTHGFVGRVYDLSIVAYHFDSLDELMSHPDCKYTYLTNHWLTGSRSNSRQKREQQNQEINQEATTP